MKKFLPLLLIALMTFAPAWAEEAFEVSGNVGRMIGMLTVDDESQGVPIHFTQEVKNAQIRHDSGAAISLETAKPGDTVLVFCHIPDGMPSITVSYTLPGDEDGTVYVRKISKSSADGSYIIMNDWYTENAWLTAERMLSLLDDGYVYSMIGANEVYGYIEEVREILPDEMPEKHYFISVAFLKDMITPELLSEEGFELRPENYEYLLRGLPETLKASFVSRMGMIPTAASSVMRADEYKILPDIPFEPGFIVFDSGEAQVIVVSVSLAGEGIVGFHASAFSREIVTSLEHLDSYILGLMG